MFFFFFFFNDTATTEIYTLSLHDALPNSTTRRRAPVACRNEATFAAKSPLVAMPANGSGILPRHGWFTRGNGLTAVVGGVEAEGDALARGGAAGAELHAAIPARTAAAAAMALPFTDNLLCCGRPARAGPRPAGDGYRRKLVALFR